MVHPCLGGPGVATQLWGVGGFVIDNETEQSRQVNEGQFPLLNSFPRPIYPRFEGRKRENKHDRGHDMSRGHGVATPRCGDLW